MHTHTITQKPSGTGSIHDIASDLHDRVIRFRAGEQIAVVLAAYYGGRGYSTHRTEEAAIAASRRNRAYSHQIIDRYGNELVSDGSRLCRRRG